MLHILVANKYNMISSTWLHVIVQGCRKRHGSLKTQFMVSFWDLWAMFTHKRASYINAMLDADADVHLVETCTCREPFGHWHRHARL